MGASDTVLGRQGVVCGGSLSGPCAGERLTPSPSGRGLCVGGEPVWAVCRGASDTVSIRQGHLVDLPLEFLQEEELTPDLGTKEAMVPTYMWT